VNLLFMLCVLLSSCSYWMPTTEPKNPEAVTLASVQAKADHYKDHAKESRDAQGFVHNKCDGLLFTALLAVATNTPDRDTILKAQGENGRWYRHALHDCYQKKESASDISNDMMLGLALYAWHFKDLDIVTGVIDYGKAHAWKMGEGDPFRTVLRPTLVATYYMMSKELGKDAGTPPENTQIDLVQEGYEAHLSVLHSLLRAHIAGKASDADIADFKAQAERQPKNALFQAAYHLYLDGDQAAAISGLAEDSLFPPGRLPTVADRCEEYLYQRDNEPGDWTPCPGGDPRPHSGTDLLFALAVSQNKIRTRP